MKTDHRIAEAVDRSIGKMLLSGATPRVLIVDDDADHAELLEQMLSKFNCDVVMAHNGSDAIAEISWNRFDLVFLDMVLPGSSGPEVLRKIREVAPKTPVVIVTGYPKGDLVAECSAYGYVGLIGKPLLVKQKDIVEIFSKHKIQLTPKCHEFSHS